jgi:hypothetical protein
MSDIVLSISIPTNEEVDSLEDIVYGRWYEQVTAYHKKREAQAKRPQSKAAKKRDRQAKGWRACYFDF